jgi:hypothetical protein
MRRLGVLSIALAIALVTAACSSGGSKKKAATVASTTTSTAPATAVTIQAFSPEAGSVQGQGGAGIVVDLVMRTKQPDLLKCTLRQTSPGRPGRNPTCPGLVVTLSTTDAALGGPQANLADLFQIVGVAQQSDGTAQVWTTWSNTLPRFGTDVDSILEAYVVRGDAPATVTADRSGLDVVSNVVNVGFHIAGGAVPGSTTSTSTVGSSTTARVTTTTVRAVATTRATTPSTAPVP